MVIKRERRQNVGAIKSGSTFLQGVVEMQADGQLTLTITDTDELQRLVFALADPINANIVGPIDSSTSAVNVMQYPHHENHDGNMYEYSNIQTVNDGNSIEFLIETPDTTEEQHLTWVVKGSAITEVGVYKGSTRVGDNEVTASVFNMNHRSANATNITLDDSITGAGADGTRFFSDHGGSAQGSFRASNESATRQERILDRNAKTLFRITSGTNGNLISVCLIFYQHTPDA